MMFRSISRNSILLGLFAVLTTAIIAGTFLGTRERIAAEQRRAEARALLEIVPRQRHDNELLDDYLPAGAADEGLGLRQERKIYVARQGGAVAAVIIPATAADGYAGDITIIVGVNADGSVAGVRTLSHRETPGLGDKIELQKSDWILGFDGKSLDNPSLEQWAVVKDGGVFDQFTGATITPRAVTGAVMRSLEYFRRHREKLLLPAAAEDDNG